MNGMLMFVPLAVFVLIIWLFVRAVMSLWNRSWFWGCLALAGVPCVLGLLVFVLPLFLPTHGKSPRAKCLNNLAQIGKAMKMYSMDHNDNLAVSFSALTNYADNAKLYICYASGHLPGDMTNVDEWADYVLVSGLREGDPRDSVHAFCLPENHKGTGTYILFRDGSVQWYDAASLAALTNDPALFFGTTDQSQLAELKARTHLVWPTNHIVRRSWWGK